MLDKIVSQSQIRILRQVSGNEVNATKMLDNNKLAKFKYQSLLRQVEMK